MPPGGVFRRDLRRQCAELASPRMPVAGEGFSFFFLFIRAHALQLAQTYSNACRRRQRLQESHLHHPPHR